MNTPRPRRLLFTPGPVQMSPEVLALGADQVPYFRNAAFSAVLQECETRLLELAGAPRGSRVIFLAGSGTLAMESVVVNLLSPEGRAAVVNGGTFGARFLELCRAHHRPCLEVAVDRDPLSDGITLGGLGEVDALLVTAHETSIGHLYDLDATGRFCRSRKCLHVVDGISLFVTDPIDMERQGIDALLLSSHKGLGLPPGLALVLLSPAALGRIQRPVLPVYLDFARYLEDGMRGQTPFTPAVSIILQLQFRLAQLQRDGLGTAIAQARDLAAHFRAGLEGLPLRPYSGHMPNAMTALEVTGGVPAHQVVQALEADHGCVTAPNGGPLRDRVFRVGHMGHLAHEDVDWLLDGLRATLGRPIAGCG